VSQSRTPASSPQSVTATSDAALPYRWRWIGLAVVIAADVMDLMDSTMTNVAGPSIRHDLGGGPATLQWLTASYTLAFAVLLVAGARLGDIAGRRRLFLLGGLGFTLASAACAAAPDPAILITLRAVQGACGALLIPQGFGMLKEIFPDREMRTVFSVFGPVMGLATIAGPIAAGLLIAANWWGAGWRLIFLVNIPVGVAALAAAARVLPRSVTHPGSRLDLPGTALVGGGLVSVIYPLIQGREDGWPAWTFILLAMGVLLLVVFAVYEQRRRESPLIEHSLLGNATFWTGMAATLAFFTAYGGITFILSMFCQLGEGFTPLHTGLTFLPMVVAMMIARSASAPFAARLGRHLVHVGVALVAVGTVVLALSVNGADHASSLRLAPGLAIIGLGANTSIGLLIRNVLAGVSLQEVGSASGILNATEQVAAALGTAILGTVFFALLLTGHHHSTHALAATAWVCLIPLAATFLLVFGLPMMRGDATHVAAAN
jgi:EmrB/QacA subfamily drug resistance transporter